MRYSSMPFGENVITDDVAFEQWCDERSSETEITAPQRLQARVRKDSERSLARLASDRDELRLALTEWRKLVLRRHRLDLDETNTLVRRHVSLLRESA